MPSKEMIGRVLSTGSATVTAEHITAFAAALGDANPLYEGAEPIAPPTYPIAFMTQAMAGGMDTFLELGLNFMTLVHGEQEFEYHRTPVAGDVLDGLQKITDIYEKESDTARMTFVVMETVWSDASTSEPVVTERFNLIARLKK